MTGLGASVFCRQAERSEVCGEPGPSQFSFGGLGRILRNQSGLVLVWPSWLPIQALAFRDLKIAGRVSQNRSLTPEKNAS